MNDLLPNLAVVPVLVGPLQVLLALLPAIAMAVFGVLVSVFRPSSVWAFIRLLWRFKLQVAGIGLLAWGATWAWPRLFPPSPVDAVAEAGDDWALFRGNPARTGALPGAEDPRDGGLNWSWSGVPGSVHASPAVVGNRVYLTTAKPGILGDGEGWIVCLDADTGELIWKSRPPGYGATFSSVVIAGDYLVCGEGLHETKHARVVCLSLKPGAEGQVLWTYATDSHVECTPVVADGRVHIGAGDDGYYCFALEPGADGQAQVLWHLPGKDYPDAETALAVHGGRMYAGLGLGGMAFCVIDAASGKELHRLDTGEPVFSPPAIAGDAVFFGSGFGDYINPAEKLKPPQKPGGTVWCLGLGDHALRWKTPLPRTVLGAVAVKDGACYAACRDGTLYRLDAATGAITGRAPCHAPLLASPAVAGETVYAVTAAGTLFAFDSGSLERVWRYQLGSGSTFLSSPAVARGRVYVGTESDGLVCAGRPGIPRVPLWTGVPAAADDTPLPAEGFYQWCHPPEQDGNADSPTITTLPAVMGGHLLVPVDDGRRRGLADLDPAAKNDAKRERWFAPVGRIRHPPVALGDERRDLARVFTGAGADLVSLDGSGTELWRVPGDDGASGVLALDREALYAQVHEGSLSRYTHDGEERWRVACPRLLHAPLPHRGLLVLVAASPTGGAQLSVVDAADGVTLWTEAVPGEEAAVGPPVALDLDLLLGTGAGLERRSLLDGSVTWSDGGAAAVGRPLVDGGHAWWADATGTVHLTEVVTGTKLATAPLALGKGGFLQLRGQVYATDGGKVVTLSFADGAITRQVWSEDDWLGPATGPSVAMGGMLFVPRPVMGLTCLGDGK